jgi:hypothetical protein
MKVDFYIISVSMLIFIIINIIRRSSGEESNRKYD